ncbi:MAG TPA: hypothetical protein VGF10_01960 [Gaiella sp.]
MGVGEESGESAAVADAETDETDEEWPALSELELDVCVADFVPGGDMIDGYSEES